jgi:DNA polymerase elongation subunit (family B)
LLIDTQYLAHSKQLLASYVDASGQIKHKYFKWDDPRKYEICDVSDKHKHPTFRSWDGYPVKQVEVSHPDRYAIYEFLDSLPKEQKAEIFDYHLPKMYFVDIEVAQKPEGGFSEPKDAECPIISISVVYDDKIILMGTDEMPKEMQTRIIEKTNDYFKKFGVEYKFKYMKYDDEFDMMRHFFEHYIPKMPLITGWNFVGYDWVYMVNRCRRLKKVINGITNHIDPAISSFTKRLNKIFLTEQEMPAHRMIFDYMQLYEICDTSVKVKESSSLDFVSTALLGVNKIKYTGSLQKLYEDDFETFMYYNCVDSILVQKIHEKTNYISIVFAISSLAQIKIVDVISNLNNALGSLAITEGVLRNRFREQDNIVLFKDHSVKEVAVDASKIEGGWVKDPRVGMNQWVVCYDFASLYPTTQRQFYIAPETFVGIVDKKDPSFAEYGSRVTKIEPDKHVVCVNGVVFEKRPSPTLRMLEDVYADRKKAKKVMMGKKDEYYKVLEEIKQLEDSL